jgi:hypothetical protein
MATSTAYILVKSLGYRYSFDGVTSISHTLSLKLATDADEAAGSDYVNNARNEPDTVTLSVVASDASVPVIGWSRQMMTTLASIKKNRYLCQVVTSLRTYSNMLLTSLNIQQDENCPDGWTGTLTFTQAEKPATVSVSHNDYASAPSSGGAAKAQSVGKQGGSVLQTILREAGIR